jgi:hypothetical protein
MLLLTSAVPAERMVDGTLPVPKVLRSVVPVLRTGVAGEPTAVVE